MSEEMFEPKPSEDPFRRNVTQGSRKSKVITFAIWLVAPVALFLVYTLVTTSQEEQFPQEDVIRSKIESGLKSLSPQDLARISYLGEKIDEITEKYLTEKEFADYSRLGEEALGGKSTPDDIKKRKDYRNRARSVCSIEEKALFDEFEQIGRKMGYFKE